MFFLIQSAWKRLIFFSEGLNFESWRFVPNGNSKPEPDISIRFQLIFFRGNDVPPNNVFKRIFQAIVPVKQYAEFSTTEPESKKEKLMQKFAGFVLSYWPQTSVWKIQREASVPIFSATFTANFNCANFHALKHFKNLQCKVHRKMFHAKMRCVWFVCRQAEGTVWVDWHSALTLQF